MSVDTTVLVFKSGTKATGFEYRVATVGAVENITEHRDIEIIQRAFSKSDVVASLEAAMELADKEEDNHLKMLGYTSEYGIRVFNWGGEFPHAEEVAV